MPPKMRMAVMVVLVLIALAAVAVVVSLLMRPTGARLDQPPQESRRVHHPAGFSIIAPEHTRAQVRSVPSPKGIEHTISVHVEGDKRIVPILHVRLRPVPPDESVQTQSMGRTTFQGEDAIISTVGFEGYDVWSALFQRGDAWYELTLHLPHDPRRNRRDWPPAAWQPYLDTFRVDPSADASATESHAP